MSTLASRPPSVKSVLQPIPVILPFPRPEPPAPRFRSAGDFAANDPGAWADHQDDLAELLDGAPLSPEPTVAEIDAMAAYYGQ